ncbi:MAG: hypothetical protein GC151_02735 [Betaproteobacteria bacterium]|nr:hypothetical protein [Betaproteobacteria bacterium]
MNATRRSFGLAIAGAAAAAFVAAAPALAGDSSGTVKVKCYGANACKGQADCKTAANACKGHNACKGKGFVMMDEKACIDRMGRS